MGGLMHGLKTIILVITLNFSSEILGGNHVEGGYRMREKVWTTIRLNMLGMDGGTLRRKEQKDDDESGGITLDYNSK